MSKRKQIVPQRNPFVVLALRKTGAGSHRKSNKAIRKQDKQRGYDENGYHTGLLIRLSEFKPQCPYQLPY